MVSALEAFAAQERLRNMRSMITDHEVRGIESQVADRGVKAKSKGTKESGQLTLIWNSSDEFDEIKLLLAAVSLRA